jgi:outer membrane protein OmpA-like peptidoglycan-associated protein
MKHQKHITVFAIFMLFMLNMPAQKLFWQKAFGGLGYDNGVKMIPVDHNCFILGGTTGSMDGIGEGNHSMDKTDLVVCRVSAEGQVIWKTVVGGSMDEQFGDMQPTRDGGILLMGTTESTDGDCNENHGKMDFLLAKIDRHGKLLWSRCYGGLGNDQGLAAIETRDGGYLIGGESGSQSGNMTYHIGALDCWVAQLDSAGNVTRERTFGGRGNERVINLLELRKDRYLAVCATTSTEGDVKDPIGEKDAWLVCFSNNLDIVWKRTYGGSDFDETKQVIRTRSGDLVLCGTSFSDDLDLEGTPNRGMGDSWIFRISEEGDLKWSRLYGGARNEGANGIAETPDGGFIMVGTSNSSDKFIVRNNGVYDGFIVRIDSLGERKWWTSFGGEDFESLFDVLPLLGGNYLTLGFAESVKGDLLPLNKEPGNDFWFFRFGDEGDDTDNLIESQPYLEGLVTSAETGKPICAEILLTDNQTMKYLKTTKSDTGTGWYLMDLPAHGTLSVMFCAPGYMFYGQDLDYSLLETSPQLRIDPVLTPIKIGSKAVLNQIVFETGSYRLRPESRPELRRLKYFLETNPRVKVEISGHTDGTGNLATKMELSERRAASVRDWLLRAGVPGRQMQITGYGASRPIGDDETEEGRAKNRRVEVEVLKIMKP